MPAFDTSTPRLSRVYQDHPVTVPAAILPGHVLTEPEAAWVNSTVATIIGNGLGGAIRRAISAEDNRRAALHKAGKWDGPTVEVKGKNGKVAHAPVPATANNIALDPQEVIDELYGRYVLAPGAEKSASDPLSKMVRALAEADASERIRAKGFTVAAFRKASASTDEYANKYEEFIATKVMQKADQFRAMAEAAMANATTDDAGTDDDLTL